MSIEIQNNDNEGVSKFKKKKKRSFLQKQKRFAKNGCFGRGTQLSADMYEYFVNIMKAINANKDVEEEMSILSSNVFEELEGNEAEYCCNQLVSRVIETLLPHTTDEVFKKFIEKFGVNLRPLFCDTFGSHVLQQTLVVALIKYKKLSDSPETDDKSENKLQVYFYDYILKISNFLYNNLEEFVWDTYSSAVARTVFNVLSGNPSKNEIKQSDLDVKVEDEKKVPQEFNLIIKKFVKRLLLWPQFNDLCNRSLNSCLLQSLLLASKNFNECSELIDKIILYHSSNELDLTDENNSAFVRLLEVVLSVADEKQFKTIYKLVFKKNFEKLATSKSGNFAVQKLIYNCSSEKLFSKIFEKLQPHMEKVMKCEYSGVLLAVVRACRNSGILQRECINMLMQLFKIEDSLMIVPLVTSLTTSENYNPETSNVNLHGCLIIQELLNFKKPITIVNSLLELPDTKLVKLLSDSRGSHITDAFVTSKTIGEKSRDRLFVKLKGHYLELATSKHGSRSLDAIWSVIKIYQKVVLAEELKSKQSELCNDLYGKCFARKIHLSSFRNDKEEWTKAQINSNSAVKYFSDFLPPAKKQKTF